MIFNMRAHHTLLAVGFSYVKQEWGKTNCVQDMPVRDEVLSVLLQANYCYLKHVNGHWHKKVLALTAH